MFASTGASPAGGWGWRGDPPGLVPGVREVERVGGAEEKIAPSGLVPGVREVYRSAMPLYSGENLRIPHDIHYSWTGWPSRKGEFPGLPEGLLEELGAELAGDGLELESHAWGEGKVHLTVAAAPGLAPVFVSQRLKGRLDHALRKRGMAVPFSRKVSLRAIGHNRTATVEAYVRDQLEHADLADPAYRERLASVAVSCPGVDLSGPAASSHGRYWYALHLVLVAAGRYRAGEEGFLRGMGKRVAATVEEQGCALKRVAVMPDHLHVALRGNPGLSPLQIGLGLQNATAEAAGCRFWEDEFYAGTFGDYDCGAVEGTTGKVRR